MRDSGCGLPLLVGLLVLAGFGGAAVLWLIPDRVALPPDGRPNYPPEQVAAGEALYRSGVANAPACVTCHLLDPQSSGLGPSLLGIYQTAGTRVPGLTAADYVSQSIVNPNAFIAPGYSANYMYQNYGAVLHPDQVEALVAYVLALPETGSP